MFKMFQAVAVFGSSTFFLICEIVKHPSVVSSFSKHREQVRRLKGGVRHLGSSVFSTWSWLFFLIFHCFDYVHISLAFFVIFFNVFFLAFLLIFLFLLFDVFF